MVQVLKELGHQRALVFFGEDGLDELTTTGPSRVYQLVDGRVDEYELDPGDLGIPRAAAEDLRGGAPAENAAMLRQILQGEPGPRRDVVRLNAAAAVIAAGRALDWPDALAIATDSLDNGRAAKALDSLVESSRSAGS
jgi:anthranilate phosphoribosyltransferase